MLNECITYYVNMTLLWRMSFAKSRYQFISQFFLRLFKYGHPLVCFRYWQYQYQNIDVLKTYFSRFFDHKCLTTCFLERLSMVAYDNILWEKQYVIFQQILIPSEKPVYASVYSLFEILSNENFSNNFLQILCYLIVRRVIRREGFAINTYIEAVLINGAKQIQKTT